jgi:hypothetical protein
MKVALYIYTESYENISKIVAKDFKARVIADGGTFEALECCVESINSLGGAFGNTTTAKRIELFDDEKISLTSSIQNINDISKVFTDYSQSFTIPASDNNNEIFKHWYENSLDNGFDQRIRYEGYIEIDTRTFRVGKWQIESASIKENRVEDYKITFYGNLKSLSDKFGEDKLKDISQINDYTIEYSGANVKSAITSTTANNVMFPLISSDRVWQYGGGGSQDISQNSHKINYNELYPALKVARIFDAIESRYGVSFSGSFINDDKFTNAYLWLKNNDAKTFISTTERKQILLNDNNTYLPRVFNIENNTYNLVRSNNTVLAVNLQASEPLFTLTITFPTSLNYTVFIYKDGYLYTTLPNTGLTAIIEVPHTFLGGAYTFFLECSIPTTYNYTYTFKYRRLLAGSPTSITYPVTTLGTSSGSLSSAISLLNYLPDMKVSDFFSGILKMFNLTAFSTDGINFTLEQLENWYYQGSIKDFSEYTTTDLDFNRIKPYKKINFEYEKSENFLSRQFFTNNSREFGNLSYAFNSDGSDYTTKLPFEDIMFSKFTGTNLQVGYCLKSDFTPYAPKPIILYRNERASCSFYLNNGTTTDHITNYNVFGQEMVQNGNINTLNWGVEISSYYLNAINNSLFNNYYLEYLNNLYSLKSRMLKVKMRLPYNELLDLKLNDRIVIRDKRYIINSFTTDLTTFESDFELIQDFRNIVPDNNFSIRVQNRSSSVLVNVNYYNGLTWTELSDTKGMISGIINGNPLILGIQANTTGVERTASIISNTNDIIIITQPA